MFFCLGCWLDATTTTSLAFWLYDNELLKSITLCSNDMSSCCPRRALVVLGEAMSRSGVQKLVLECNQCFLVLHVAVIVVSLLLDDLQLMSLLKT